MATATFGDSEATRVIAAIEERARRRTKNGALMHTTWGKVASTDASGANVFLYDEIQNQLVASEGFRIPKGYAVAVNDIVKVWIDSGNGERWLDSSTCTLTTVEDGFLTIQAVASEVNEGGELILEGAAANPDWKLDVYQTSFRIHSAGTSHVLVNSTRTNLFGTLTFGASEDTNLYRSLANVLKTDDTFQAVGGVKVTSPSSADGQNFEAFRTQLPNNGYVGYAQYILAEANPTFRISGTGTLSWGPGGATAVDTTLFREGAGLLATNDALRVSSLVVGTTGAGQSADGLNIIGGSIEMRNANPFIDFKTSDIDFGARIIYDFSVADALEFSGATTYRFDNVVVFGSDVSLGARQMSGAAPIVRVYTSGANTWTKPANFSHIIVEVVGGGGGGGGTAATAVGENATAGGGGGGGYARKLFTAADLSGAASFTATVGAGGTGATAGANGGGTGGASTFAGTGITTVSGGGGTGGGGSLGTTGNLTAAAGVGGAGTGGDVNVTGTDSGRGETFAGRFTSPVSGSSALGGGSVAGGTSAGSTGALYGGGGTGANAGASAAARAGGAGGAGIVIVTEYYFA